MIYKLQNNVCVKSVGRTLVPAILVGSPEFPFGDEGKSDCKFVSNGVFGLQFISNTLDYFISEGVEAKK